MKLITAYQRGLLTPGMIVNVTKNTCPGHGKNTGLFQVTPGGSTMKQLDLTDAGLCALRLACDYDGESEIELEGYWQEPGAKAPWQPKFNVGDIVRVYRNLDYSGPNNGVGRIMKVVGVPKLEKNCYSCTPESSSLAESWSECNLEMVETNTTCFLEGSMFYPQNVAMQQFQMAEEIRNIQLHAAIDRESFMAYKPKKGFIMGIVKKIKDLALDTSSAALRRNGFEDEDGKMTELAQGYVDDLVSKEKWAAVRDQVAADVLKVEASEKK